MQRWTDLDQVPADAGPSVVTIGTFDGVHRGHRAVLAAVVASARAEGSRAVALTFDRHPAQVHRPDEAPPVLTGLTDRLELLGQTGLDAVLVVPYTLRFARQSPEEFVERYLVRGLGATRVVVGADIRFGWGNAGDLATMRALGDRHGFEVVVVEDVVPQVDEPAGRRWSSTWVREMLQRGDVAGAARCLGRPHRVRGVVVHGDARGRTLGFPTANLSPEATGLVPADGVYAGWLLRPERQRSSADDGPTQEDRAGAGGPGRLPAAVSIGTNPTFEGSERRVEAYVLDRTDLELYGEEVVVELVEMLRPTLRFDGVEELVQQMRLDVERCRDVLQRAAAVGPGRDEAAW